MNGTERTSLDRMALGGAATVIRVEGDDPVARRLVDLGFWPGTTVQAVRKAPLGDPVQYNLRGFRLALRRDEACRVVVQPLSGAAVISAGHPVARRTASPLVAAFRMLFGLKGLTPASATHVREPR